MEHFIFGDQMEHVSHDCLLLHVPQAGWGIVPLLYASEGGGLPLS